MSSKARAVFCLLGIMGVMSFADVASAGPRRWYDGSRGGAHWQRRSIRLGANPGWAGYNNRWRGYGRRHAYARRYDRRYSWPAYRSGQQFALAMGGYGGGGSAARTGYGMNGQWQGFNGGYGGGDVGGGGSGGAYGTSGYGTGGGNGDNASGSSGCVSPNGSCPIPSHGNGNSGIAPSGPVASTKTRDDGTSLSRAMAYRPASYCSFCYGSSSEGRPLSPGGRPSQSSPSDRKQQLFALADGL